MAKDDQRVIRLRIAFPILEHFSATNSADVCVFTKLQKSDWSANILWPRDGTHAEQIKVLKIKDEWKAVERKVLTQGVMKVDKDLLAVGQENTDQNGIGMMESRFLKKKPKKTVQFALPQPVVRLPAGSILQISLTGDLVNKNDENINCWNLPIFEEFTDCQISIDMKPNSEIEKFIRQLLEKEQNKLNSKQIIQNPDIISDLQSDVQSDVKSISTVTIEDNVENGMQINEDSGEKEAFDLNSIEFKAQITCSIMDTQQTIPTNSNTAGNNKKEKEEEGKGLRYEFTIGFQQAREYLGLPIPEASKAHAESGQDKLVENKKTIEKPIQNEKPAISGVKAEFLKRIEQQAAEAMRNGFGKNKPASENKGISTANEIPEQRRPVMKQFTFPGNQSSIAGKTGPSNEGQRVLLALRRTASLAKPRVPFGSTMQNKREIHLIMNCLLAYISFSIELCL